MAKVKNKRNFGHADKVQKKKRAEIHKKKLNPFEVHINREKIKVLGQKSKHDRGLPGVSRAKAIQKRKETLGTEMKLMHKTNTFIDRRIGEKSNELSAEDKIIARFAAERAKQHNRKNIYNLADDEVLTHRGQTLEQIEKFDDPRSSDEEEEEGRKFGGLDDEFVSEGHFGGGVLSRSESKDGAKSHKDLIEQLIAESKKRKAEKQKEKEQTLDLTDKLDSEWKDLQPVVLKKARVEEESAIDKLLSGTEKNNQDYDKMMRELRFEKRGTPSDGLKSEEKQAKEEQQKIEQLEKEREQRMLDEDGDTIRAKQPASKHRSADDLEDNFDLDEDQGGFMLAYDRDGYPLMPEMLYRDNMGPDSNKNKENGIAESSSDEAESDDEEEEDNEKKEEVNHNSEKTEATRNSEDSSDDDSSDDGSSEEKKEAVEQSDKKAEATQNNDDSSDENDDAASVESEEAKELTKVINKEDKETILFSQKEESGTDESEEDDDDDDEEEEASEAGDEDNFNDINDLKHSDKESSDEEMANENEVKEKIDSFFNMKSSEGDNLKELLTGKSPTQQALALQKLIKSYDPSLAENNKDLLSRLYAHLLQYINDIFTNLKEESEVIKAFLILDKISPYLYDLSHTNKVSTKKYMIEVLEEKHEQFRKNPKRVPDLDTLVFFKLVSLIYPTSDFRHPVTTPSLIFLSEILTLSKFRDAYSLSRGLFLTALVLEYTVLSKRYLPSPINFLRGLFYITANTSIINPIQVVPPFRLHKDAKILKLEQDCSKMAAGNKMAARDLVLEEIDGGFKIRCFYTALRMLREFFDNFQDLEAQACMFEPHISLLSRVDLDMYPKSVAGFAEETLSYMRQCLEVKTYTLLTNEVKKTKVLRQFEPDVQDVFTGSKNAKQSKEKIERDKLAHKYKKEMKGALREIRRDKAYIASVKIRQKIHSDNIRKDKVKQIYKDASIQQSELNKLKRMK